jgi:hypothetical protein
MGRDEDTDAVAVDVIGTCPHRIAVVTSHQLTAAMGRSSGISGVVTITLTITVSPNTHQPDTGPVGLHVHAAFTPVGAVAATAAAAAVTSAYCEQVLRRSASIPLLLHYVLNKL